MRFVVLVSAPRGQQLVGPFNSRKEAEDWIAKPHYLGGQHPMLVRHEVLDLYGPDELYDGPKPLGELLTSKESLHVKD